MSFFKENDAFLVNRLCFITLSFLSDGIKYIGPNYDIDIFYTLVVVYFLLT